MSNKFPAFRFLGDKVRAVGHIKRGMLELFRTQAVQERMGVPVFQRTVEVDAYTTIRVSVNKEQTFVYIESQFEPRPGSEEAEEPRKEPPLCPSAFLIRKFDRTLKGASVNVPEREGLLIAYNHDTGRWQVASFLTESGETEPFAANLGWFYTPPGADADGVRTSECDAVTWHGLSTPNFEIPLTASTTQSGFPAQKTALQRVFYFQGRKFAAPGTGYVLGACILIDDGIKYMYVHSATLQAITTGANVRTYQMLGEESHRIKLGSLLGGSISGWESMGIVSLADLGVRTYGGALSRPHMGHPRSAAYIDKDGYSYNIREFNDRIPIEFSPTKTVDTEHHGMTAFVKYDLRTMEFEILSTSNTSAPIEAVSIDAEDPISASPSFDVPRPDAGTSGTVSYSMQNAGRPWIFYVYPGTEHLYTLGIEYNHSANLHTLWPKGPAGGDPEIPGFHNTVCNMTTDLILFKDGVEHDRINLFTLTAGITATGRLATISYPQPSDVYCRVRNILEFHPDMDDSLRFTESELSAGVWQKFLYQDGRRTLVYSKDFSYFNLSGEPHIVPTLHFMETARWLGVDDTDIPYSHSVAIPHITSFYNDGNNGDTRGVWSQTPVIALTHYGWPELLHAGCGLYFRFAFGSATIHDLILPSWCAGIAGEFASGIGYNSRMTGAQAHKYGKQGGLWFPETAEAGGAFWMAEGFAVHRKVKADEKRPYILLRRPIYSSTPYAQSPDLAPAEVYANQSWRDAQFYVADSDPRLDPGTSPDPYEQDTTGYVSEGVPHSRWFWQWWMEPTGVAREHTGMPPYDPAWNEDAWELVSNFITSQKLNDLTGDEDTVFFDIGIL